MQALQKEWGAKDVVWLTVNSTREGHSEYRTGAQMGEWMKVYGETIYGTRGGLVAPHDWGVTTQKDNRLFVHILNLQDRSLFLPIGSKKIRKAVDFATRKAVKTQKCDGGVLISLDEVPTDVDKVIEIQL